MSRFKIFSWLFLGCFIFIPNCFGENTWQIRINIPEFKLYLYHSDEIYGTYRIAVGKIDTPSPLGDFWIVNKVIDPTWYPPDGKTPVPPGQYNPLGRYWMGLNIEGFGIHGNSADWSIGSPVSLGCFRMYNKDIKKIFELVPVGTPVEVTYQTVNISVDKNNLAWLELYPDIYHITNRDNEIANGLANINWVYEPHKKALTELLQGKSISKIEIPRQIKIDGNFSNMDGFYWGGSIYLMKSSQSLPVNIGSIKDNNPFDGYYKLDLNNLNSSEQRYIWDSEINTLQVQRLKIFINGVELSNGIHLNQGRVRIDLQKIAKLLNTAFLWDAVSKVAICKECTVLGEVSDGHFWIETGELNRIWPGLQSHWDEKSGILKIMSE